MDLQNMAGLNGLSAEELELFQELLADEGIELEGDAAIPRRPAGEHPMSSAQRRMWFLDQLERGAAVYNIAAALWLTGELDVQALHASLQEIVTRHEALRASFHDEAGEPRQAIADLMRLVVSRIDLDHLGEERAEREVSVLAAAEGHCPFDLEHGPLVRVQLLRLAATRHALIFTMHHIVSDGWSIGVQLRELAALYGAFRQGRPSPLPELGIQYPDYAAWQLSQLDRPAMEAHLAYWKEKLAGRLPVLELPSDRPRAALQSSRGARHPLPLSAELDANIRGLAEGLELTPFMVLSAAIKAWLCRYTGQTDLLLGFPIANRTRPETEELIGLFVNSLVLRTDLGGDPTFAELLSRVQETTLEAYEHQDLPFERLVDTLAGRRDLGHNPIFQVMFSLQNAPLPALELPGDLRLSVLDVDPGVTKFDLSLDLWEGFSELGYIEYSTELFDAATVARMAEHFVRLLAAAVEDPRLRLSELPLMSAVERRQVVEEWSGVESAGAAPAVGTLSEARAVHRLFEEQAARCPAHPAVVLPGDGRGAVGDDEALDYGTLDRRANHLAHRLVDLGVGPETRVAFALERSPVLLVSLLAILKAGGAYVPLDPTYPASRLRSMLEDSAASVLITQRGALDPEVLAARPGLEILWVDRSTEDERQDAPQVMVHGEHPAYVIYTSGSTGRPKGVTISHHALALFVSNAVPEFGVGPSDRLLQFASISFDTSAEEIFCALTRGATLVLRSSGMIDSMERFLSICRRTEVSILDLPTAFWHFLVAAMAAAAEPSADASPGAPPAEDLALPPRLRLVIIGGEQALAKRVDQWHRLVGDRVRLVNTYGPTEATIVSTFCDLGGRPPLTQVSIGGPVSHTAVFVLDSHGWAVPTGVPGELCLTGGALARGYLSRPKETAERFVPAPYGLTGARLYRTGDRVRFRADGVLDFLGRVDHQVKVAGFRIELGEIEATLVEHPAVRQAVASPVGEAESIRLAAWVEPRADDDLTVPALRDFLAERLPAHMVPSFFTLMPELPLLPNGKIDRRSLPEPDAGGGGEGPLPPRNAREETLVEIWSELLGCPVGVEDNFFELGGHSLLATQLTARIRQRFAVEISLKDLFQEPTVAALAWRIESAAAAVDRGPPLEPCDRGQPLPLSFAQSRLWFLDQLEPGGAAYNLPLPLALYGALDEPALEGALRALIERQEILRTVYRVDQGDHPQQVVLPTPEQFLRRLDLASVLPEERRAEAHRQIAEEVRRPFDLGQGPVFRGLLLRVHDEEHLLVLTVHHIAADGWSVGVLLRELMALYDAQHLGQASALPALAVHYADFAVWQRQWLRGEVLETQLAYWRERLAGLDSALDLPTDRPRPAVQSQDGRHVRGRLPASLLTALDTFGRARGATLFMTLLAAFDALLMRLSGQGDLAVGTPIANRQRIETEHLVGFFVNTLVMRCKVGRAPAFEALLGEVQRSALMAYRHQDLPFEKLIEEVQPERRLSHAPLFQVMFVMENTPPARMELAGLRWEPLEISTRTTKFDLLMVAEANEAGSLDLFLEYSSELFDATTMRRFLLHFETLLEGALGAPETSLHELPLLPSAHRQQLLVEWNSPPVPSAPLASGRTLHGLFGRQVARTPEQPALRHGVDLLTYLELETRANRLAHHLIALGVGPEQRVGIYLDRGIDLVVALLATLKAGAAYVPLDPEYPDERVAFMLEDSGATVVITDRPVALPGNEARILHLGADTMSALESQPGQAPDSAACDRNLAYLIYTSGSTGRPKAVAIEHRSAVAMVAWAHGVFEAEDLAGVLAATSVCFDLSIFELFVPLAAGGKVILVANALELAMHPAAHEVRLINTVPSALQGLLDLGPLAPGVRTINLAGEPLKAELVARAYRQTGVERVFDLYGPSEDTTYSTAALQPRGTEHPLIGRPLPGTQAYLVDLLMQSVPAGAAGELLLAGDGLARGYLGRPALTAERFTPDPWGPPGGRLYRTGDLARYRAAGELDFLGRLDHQVKIRGFRIELGEIESALEAQETVSESVVMVQEDGPHAPRLVAWVVAAQDTISVTQTAADSGEDGVRNGLLRALGERLPDYMLPAVLLFLPTLPLTPNGKIDRLRLPMPEGGQRQTKAEFLAPSTPTEEVLVTLWQDLLGLDRVGVHDDFFDLGGHSLLATQMMSRVRRHFHLDDLPLAEIFKEPTISSLAQTITRIGAEEASEELPDLIAEIQDLSPEEIERLLAEEMKSMQEPEG